MPNDTASKEFKGFHAGRGVTRPNSIEEQPAIVSPKVVADSVRPFMPRRHAPTAPRFGLEHDAECRHPRRPAEPDLGSQQPEVPSFAAERAPDGWELLCPFDQFVELGHRHGRCRCE
jgi:hypothetical protein